MNFVFYFANNCGAYCRVSWRMFYCFTRIYSEGQIEEENQENDEAETTVEHVAPPPTELSGHFSLTESYKPLNIKTVEQSAMIAMGKSFWCNIF